MSKGPPAKNRAAPSAGAFPVVAVGASAGGLDAYTEFFHALPVDTGMAFVLIQHLDPKHRSLLAEILSKATTMRVEEVETGAEILPDRVYVIPSNTLMSITHGIFTLIPREADAGRHLSINFFMRSLAAERGSSAIGIILSGTGADGTVGLENIKAEGGITFVQDPSTAKFDGMPRSAIDSGCVDFVLPPREIAQELRRIQHHPYVRAEDPANEMEGAKEQAEELTASVETPVRDETLLAILGHLRKASGVDFTQYRPKTIQRRALRRMVILKLETLEEYEKHLLANPEEASRLYEDVLIPVTSFFRDFEAFEALKTHVYPVIVNDKANRGSIRMWAPGCSTGEETYSLAMTLLEYLGEKASSFQVQIFGTDLNEKGIQKARAGVYRESIAEEISPERIARFFVKVEGGYRINKAVRDMCVFARQNVANDPPFSQMNLVACRNLLIYIQPSLQKKIIPILHYALKPSGFLVLGGSESVSAFPDLFGTIDKKHKIYSKRAIQSRLHYDFAQSYYPTRDITGALVNGSSDTKRHPLGAGNMEVDIHAEADLIVLKNHAPVGVIVNSAMDVIQFRGRTTPYLEPAPGKASLNLLKLARNGLAVELRALIVAARKKGVPVRKSGIRFGDEGQRRVLDLSVSPLGWKAPSADCSFLVLFDDVTALWPPDPDKRSATVASVAAGGVTSKRLQQEIADLQSSLRSSLEAEGALRDEFQSANEEILSANEELQSSNEELETSKEELQSTNEELNTVNAELRHKNVELQELGNDISNLLNSTRIPAVMLDLQMRIRRLTPTANRLLKAVPSDVGRPIGDLKLNIHLPTLEPMIAQVLETLRPWEQEVMDTDDCWHSLNILPYRTQDNKIDGVVLALHDIDAIKQANERLKKSAEFFRAIIDTVRQPLLVLDAELRVVAINQPFQDTFGTSSERTMHQPLSNICNGRWNIEHLRKLLETVLADRRPIANFEFEQAFDGLGRRKMLLNAAALPQLHDPRPLILLAIEDITERRHVEAALIKSEKLAAAGRLAATLAHEINNPLQAVTNLLALLEDCPNLEPTERSYIKTACYELSQVTDLTRQSLSFFREATFTRAVNLEETLDVVLKIYRKRIAAKSLNVMRRYRASEPIISYPGEIRQILASLVLNAVQASCAGGNIYVRVRNVPAAMGKRESGVLISIADTGIGVPPKNRVRIFDPFFSTKGEEGTGLGLWIAQGMVSRLGGAMRMRSSVRHGKSGTCFSLYLPELFPPRAAA